MDVAKFYGWSPNDIDNLPIDEVYWWKVSALQHLRRK